MHSSTTNMADDYTTESVMAEIWIIQINDSKLNAHKINPQSQQNCENICYIYSFYHCNFVKLYCKLLYNLQMHTLKKHTFI